MRQIPDLAIEKIAVYKGHAALALHYRDNNGQEGSLVHLNDRQS
jgi:hypothetical protein